MGVIVDVVLPIALAFIMFSLGVGLELADFRRVLERPRDLLIGVLSQIILLPVVALLLVTLWPLPRNKLMLVLYRSVELTVYS